MPPEAPRRKGPCSPFSGHSCLLHLQWPLITKVIETPDCVLWFVSLIPGFSRNVEMFNEGFNIINGNPVVYIMATKKEKINK